MVQSVVAPEAGAGAEAPTFQLWCPRHHTISGGVDGRAWKEHWLMSCLRPGQPFDHSEFSAFSKRERCAKP